MNGVEYLNKENIYNLTTLWRLAGEFHGGFEMNEKMCISHIPHSEWPSRAWFCSTQPNPPDKDDYSFASRKMLKLSVWGDKRGSLGQSISKNFLKHSIRQTAMYLPKPWLVKEELTIELQKVKDSREAGRWSNLFEEAFGYSIPFWVVESTSKFADYYIAYHKTQPVGTVMLFTDYHNNAGIHSLGVVPGFRKRGFAREITLGAIQLLKAANPENIFLQASDAALHLYRKLGFVDQFEMNTYTINRH